MTIKKLEYTRDTHGTYSPSSAAVIGKINEIIDYVNRKDQFSDNSGKVEQDWVEEAFNRFCDTTHYEGDANDMAMFRDAIETFMSKPVEQEPNKIELVPLDCRKAINDIVAFIPTKKCGKVDIPTYRGFVKRILSKYGVPTQEERIADVSKTLPVPSTIEGVAEKIYDKVLCRKAWDKTKGIAEIKELLSPLSPIGKKQEFTKEEIEQKVSYIWERLYEDVEVDIQGLKHKKLYDAIERAFSPHLRPEGNI